MNYRPLLNFPRICKNQFQKPNYNNEKPIKPGLIQKSTSSHPHLSATLKIMQNYDIGKNLKKIYQADKKLLENTQVPIMTVSAAFREDLKGLHRQKEEDKSTDIVLSRAHYSMAMGVAVQAWGEKIDPKKAWLVDSTNYVSNQAFRSVALTHAIGKIIARWPILKTLKDMVDKFGRSKMPILDNVTPPTLYLGANINKTILSMHIVTGNILAAEGKKVMQMITDPHVRSDYLENAHLPNMRFLVFDEHTKEDFFALAKKIGKRIPPSQIKDKVIVTGPPIDPRIVACNQNKKIWTKDRPLKICLTTGGLGTNKPEIKRILEQLLPVLKQQALGQKTDLVPTQLVLYAGTHRDHLDMAIEIAQANKLAYQIISPKDPAHFRINAKLKDDMELIDNRFSIIYHPQIVDANEIIIQKAFPFADLFISKPSGDKAYDAVVSGSALLTLKEWGEWEHNVRAVFEKNGTAQVAKVDNIIEQLVEITSNNEATFETNKLVDAKRPVPGLKEISQKSWLAQAMYNAKNLDPIFYRGARNILKAVKENNLN